MITLTILLFGLLIASLLNFLNPNIERTKGKQLLIFYNTSRGRDYINISQFLKRINERTYF